jgi:uncharacterized protein with PQ loop repeat
MNIKSILISIVFFLTLAVGVSGWYLYGYLQSQKKPAQDVANTQENQTAQNNSEGDSVVEISQELNQTPNDTTINNEMSSFEAEVEGF